MANEAESVLPNGASSLPAADLAPDDVAALRAAGRQWADVPRPTDATAPLLVDPDLDLVEAIGSRPGERYVRVVRSRKQGFEKVAPGWLQATHRASQPTSAAGRATRHLRQIILGTPLASRQMVHERLTKIKALAVLSSDALSSVAYATEQILAVFVGAGAAAVAFHHDLLIMGAIAFLMFAIVLSYRQTIKAYPKGGGSYIVAKDNLGPLAGLVAASALMTDYVLTVAVSISTGVSAITSAIPELTVYTVPLCIAFILVIVLGNLRGIREAGTIFAAPTYFFIAAMLGLIGTLLVKIATGACAHSACASTTNYPMPSVLPSVGLFLILQAFASGCSAITGVEAISDGVPAFKAPEWRNARVTLTAMGLLLGTMFVGLTVVTHVLGVAVDDPGRPGYDMLLSKLARIAFGSGSIGYGFVIVTTTAILVLAANTAFSDFPRLFFFLARDDYAPHQFRRLGDRLAFSNGIIVLALLAIVLVVVFNGDVSRLIPLYAIGVFLAFTMSQGGMVVRWLRRREPGWRHGLPMNVVGMTMTAVVFVVFAAVKFREGAWVVCLIIPTFVALFFAVHRHYSDVNSQLATETPTAPALLKPVCIVPIADLNGIALQSLAMARTLSDNVIAVHVCDDENHIAQMRAKWEVWGNHVTLEIIESPFRSFLRPLLAYIDAIDRQRTDDTVVILLPELVATRWWHHLLHNQSALRLKAALLFRPGTIVINIPYHLQRHRRSIRAVDRDAI